MLDSLQHPAAEGAGTSDPSPNPPGIDRLIDRWRTCRDQRAFGALLHQYRSFVYLKVGQAQRQWGVDPDDAYQAISLALARCLETYDHSLGALTTHWGWRIRNTIVRDLVPGRDTISRPAHHVGDLLTAQRTGRQMRTEGAEPTDQDIADRLGWPLRRVIHALHPPRAVSASTPLGDDGLTIEHTLEDASDLARPDVVAEVQSSGRAAGAALAAAMGALTPRQARVVRGRLGEGLTLDDLGQELGVSRERVRQLEGIGLAKLRPLLQSDPRVRAVLD